MTPFSLNDVYSAMATCNSSPIVETTHGTSTSDLWQCIPTITVVGMSPEQFQSQSTQQQSQLITNDTQQTSSSLPALTENNTNCYSITSQEATIGSPRGNESAVTGKSSASAHSEAKNKMLSPATITRSASPSVNPAPPKKRRGRKPKLIKEQERLAAIAAALEAGPKHPRPRILGSKATTAATPPSRVPRRILSPTPQQVADHDRQFQELQRDLNEIQHQRYLESLQLPSKPNPNHPPSGSIPIYPYHPAYQYAHPYLPASTTPFNIPDNSSKHRLDQYISDRIDQIPPSANNMDKPTYIEQNPLMYDLLTSDNPDPAPSPCDDQLRQKQNRWTQIPNPRIPPPNNSNIPHYNYYKPQQQQIHNPMMPPEDAYQSVFNRNAGTNSNVTGSSRASGIDPFTSGNARSVGSERMAGSHGDHPPRPSATLDHGTYSMLVENINMLRFRNDYLANVVRQQLNLLSESYEMQETLKRQLETFQTLATGSRNMYSFDFSYKPQQKQNSGTGRGSRRYKRTWERTRGVAKEIVDLTGEDGDQEKVTVDQHPVSTTYPYESQSPLKTGSRIATSSNNTCSGARDGEGEHLAEGINLSNTPDVRTNTEENPAKT